MKATEFRPEFLQLAMRDHEIISRYLQTAEKLFESGPVADDTADLAALEQLIGAKLLEHFAYEETNIFPALVAGGPHSHEADQARSLEAGHQVMRGKIHALHRLLIDQGRGGRRSGALHEAMVDFFGLLFQHVAAENELFMSLLQEYRRAL